MMTGQLTMFDASGAARESMRDQVARLRGRVLDAIRAAGRDGLTSDEVEVRLGMSHQTCSARFHELAKLGEIEKAHVKRRTRSRRWAEAWRAK